MTPLYKILSAKPNSPPQDLTPIFANRLTTLALTDNADGKSGTLRLTIENSTRTLAAPDHDTILQVHLGYAGAPLRDMGNFTVDERKLTAPPDKIEIGAKTASFTTDPAIADKYAAMQTRQSRSWEAGTTIADLVATIAAQYGLQPYTSPTSAKIALPHIDQTDESDANLLLRIAAQNNAWVRVAFGKIAFADQRDTSISQPGPIETTPVLINRADVTSYNFADKKRNTYASVTAIYQDLAAAKTVVIVAGEGVPIYAIPSPHSTREAAQRAADSKYIELIRAGKSFDLTMPAPATMNLVAGGTINAQDFDPQIDGLWKVSSVEWNLSKSGLTASVRCEPTATAEEPESTATE